MNNPDITQTADLPDITSVMRKCGARITAALKQLLAPEPRDCRDCGKSITNYRLTTVRCAACEVRMRAGLKPKWFSR